MSSAQRVADALPPAQRVGIRETSWLLPRPHRRATGRDQPLGLLDRAPEVLGAQRREHERDVEREAQLVAVAVVLHQLGDLGDERLAHEQP